MNEFVTRNGIISKGSVAVSGSTITGSSTDSFLSVVGTWNTAGAPSMVRLSISDTSSLGVGSYQNGASFLKCEKDGSSVIELQKAGGILFGGAGYSTSRLYKTSAFGTTVLDCAPYGGGNAGFEIFGGADHQAGISLNPLSTYPSFGFGFGVSNRLGYAPSGSFQYWYGTGGEIQQRNGTQSQVYRVYGTYTDSSNYVRASLSASATTVALLAETAGTGADDVPIILLPAGTGSVGIGVTGTALSKLHINAGNYGGIMMSYDASGNFRHSIENYYFGNSPSANTMTFKVSDGTVSGAISTLTLRGNGTATVLAGLNTSYISIADKATNYANFSTQAQAGICIGQNVHANDSNQLKIVNSHGSVSGTAIKMPGNSETRQNYIEFWTTPVTAVTSGSNYAQSSPRVVISPDGYVGIGDDNPSEKLTVSGSIRINGSNNSVYTTFAEAGAVFSITKNGTFVMRVGGVLIPNFEQGASVGTFDQTGASMLMVNTTANKVGSIVRGAASQTANLQEWQNSSGSILSYVDSVGTVKVNGTYIDSNNYVRASLSASSTAVTLAAETAGTGEDNVDINITPAGTGNVIINRSISNYAYGGIQIACADYNGFARPAIWFKNTHASADYTTARISSQIGNSGTNADLLIETADGSENLVTRLSIDKNGKFFFNNAIVIGSVTYSYGSSEGMFLNNYCLSGGDSFRRVTDFAALGNWDGTNGGSVIRFLTNPKTANDAVERLLIDQNGDVQVSSGLLRFYGSTASYPALKRDGTSLCVRLADDSAYSQIVVSAIRFGSLSGPHISVSSGRLVTYEPWYSESSFQSNVGGFCVGAGGGSAPLFAFSLSSDTNAAEINNSTIGQLRDLRLRTLQAYYGAFDASNYVRASLSAGSSSVTLAAETAGTGAANVDVNIIPAGAGGVVIKSFVTPLFGHKVLKLLSNNGADEKMSLTDDGNFSVAGSITTTTSQVVAGSGSTYAAVNLNYFTLVTGGNPLFYLGGLGDQVLGMRRTGRIGWADTVTDPSASPDTGIARNAAGIVEINNGTAGQFRDLKLRDLIHDGQAARSITAARHTTADTAGNNLTVQAGGATSGSTDKSGGTLYLLPGISTGNAESGVVIQGCLSGSSGTSDCSMSTVVQVLGDKIGFFGSTPVGVGSAQAITCSHAINSLSSSYSGYAGVVDKIRTDQSLSSPESGSIWIDSIQKSPYVSYGGFKHSLVGTIYTQTEDVVVSNTTNETSLTGSSFFGTNVLPAGIFTPGKTIRLFASGEHSTTGNADLVLRLRLGSTEMAVISGSSGNGTDQPFDISSILTCIATGSNSGSFNGFMRYTEHHPSGLSQADSVVSVSSNTDINNPVGVTVEWATASPSNTITCRMLTIEVLN